MLKRVLLSYVLTELAVAALLIWALGLGWTFVILAGMFMAGVVLGASQLRSISPRRDPADAALIGGGNALVFLPGIVTTAAGVLMLAPPTRGALRPLAEAMVKRGIARRITVPNLVRSDYIDGEVIGEVVEHRRGNAVALSR